MINISLKVGRQRLSVAITPHVGNFYDSSIILINPSSSMELPLIAGNLLVTLSRTLEQTGTQSLQMRQTLMKVNDRGMSSFLMFL